MSNQIKIYTDGSAHHVTQYGAWAFIVVHPDGREENHCQSYEAVTNNKMELCAALEALDYIVKSAATKDKQAYALISDSAYVVNGCNSWRHTWKLKKWKGVKNLPLWLAVDALLDTIEQMGIFLTVSWVRGHSGDEYNEKVDKLVYGEYKKLADNKTKL